MIDGIIVSGRYVPLMDLADILTADKIIQLIHLQIEDDDNKEMLAKLDKIEKLLREIT